ncbi:ribonuclease H-like domain-containing protein [Tanacetum coccineum]
MAVPKDHLRRFHGMDDAKEIWAAIKTRFGGNANSKKMQKAVLKQQFEAFTISTKESLEKGYDRFQKLLSQLDALGASVSDEDANHKFLRSLPPAWDSLAMTMRTKKNIDTLSIDDLYNNLSVFEQDIQKTSSSSLSSENVAFLSQAKASSSKHKPSHSSGSYSSYTTSSSKATPTATPGLADEVIHSFLATNADDVDLIHEDLDQIDDLDLEEMDINWQIAMTAIKIKKFYKKTGRRPRVDGKMHVAFDKRKVECFNCHNTGHFARECKFKGSKEGSRQEASRGQDFKPVRTEKEALMTIDEGQINWVEQTEDEELNHALMAFTVNNEVGYSVRKGWLLEQRFETYVKSKDLDIWHIITYGDFPSIQNNPETKKDEIVPFEKQSDDLKKKLAKNNEAKMKDSEIVKGKREQNRSFALKAKRESSDEDSLTSDSKDEEYAMTVRVFKKFLKRRGRFIQIISSKNAQNYQEAIIKEPTSENRSDSDKEGKEKTKDEKCLMAEASNEVSSKTEFFSDDLSSLDEKDLDSEYN